MKQQHPVTPPQWQMDGWQAQIETMGAHVPSILLEVIQWGREQANADIERERQEAADQELEACCEWIESELRGQLRPAWRIAKQLRAARRPKPPSLKEQALTALTRYTTGETILTNESVDTIRRALEQLDG